MCVQRSGTTVMRIDINSDMGESFGAYTIGHDAGLMKSITSANIAAGFHAGDPSVLRATIRLAKAHGVAVGAHPGYPDLVGFGRRAMAVSPKEAEDFVLYQIAAVAGVASDGSVVPLDADTICVHGDTPGSDELAARIRAGLEQAGILVKAIGAS